MKPKFDKKDLEKITKEEMFVKLRASAARTLDNLEKAYEAGMKEGITEDEQDQMIDAMRRAKALRDKVLEVTGNHKDNPQK